MSARKSLAVVLALTLVVAVVAAHAIERDGKKPAVLQVSQLTKSPAKYAQAGDVRVSGIVSEVKARTRSFVMADDGACAGCPIRGCVSSEMTVLYTGGDLPKSKQKVLVTGRLHKTRDGKYFFKATNIEAKK